MANAYALDGFDEQDGPAQYQEQREREDKLLRMLKNEEEAALGFAESDTTEQQIDALQRYFGEKYGDEEEGRSQVVTREVLETIEWQRNDYARILASGGNVISLEETSEADAKYAKDAADYLSWIFFSDNPGFENLDDFVFDGLLHRRGYLACYWRDKEYRAPQTLTGLNIMQVMQLQNDPQVEIIGQDFDQESEAGGISLVVRRTKSPARAEIVSIAPEDMRLNGRAVTIDGARYIGRVQRMLCGEAVRLWPEKAEEIIAACASARGDNYSSRRSSDVRQERFKDNDDRLFLDGNDAAMEAEVLEEYLRVDLNEDGYPETIRSYRIGDLLLEESEVEENPFGSWTPIRIPHRFMGLSVHDITQDLQRQSTVLTRAGLDAVYQAVVSREAYDVGKVDEVGEQAMLSTASGVKIPVKGNPNDIIKQMSGGIDTAETAWNASALLQRRLEDRTGSSRQTRGLDSDQLTKEHSGKALGMLQLNADARKEMTARNLASGLGHFVGKLYRLVCRNQNEARQIAIGGRFAQFDPRTWNSDLRVTVFAGGVNREHALVGLQMIGLEQEKVIQALGPGNPIVTPKNRYRYQEELCRAAGWKSAEMFFTEAKDQPVIDPQTGQPAVDPETGEPQTQAWAPPPQEDPAMAKVKADAEAKKAEMALKTEETKASLGLQKQKDDAALQSEREKNAMILQIMQEKAALEAELARMKADAEAALAQQKAEAEVALAWAKLEREDQLAREKMDREYELEMMKISAQERVGKANASAKAGVAIDGGDDTDLPANRPGGDLSE